MFPARAGFLERVKFAIHLVLLWIHTQPGSQARGPARARPLTGAYECMPGLRWAMDEVPLPQVSFLSFDDQQALA